MGVLKILMILLGVLVLSITLLRAYDFAFDLKEEKRLLELQSKNPELYHAGLISNLPEPAQRYFSFVIKEGTPLLTVAEIN